MGTGLIHPVAFSRPQSSLLTGLSAYWKCDEASGNLLDVLGNTNCTATNAPTSVAGLAANTVTARGFNAAASRYFQAAPNAAMNTVNGSWAVSCWVTMGTIASPLKQYIFNKSGGANGGYALYIRNNAGTDEITWLTSQGGSDANVKITSANPIAGSIWIYAEHNAAAGTLYMRAYFGGLDHSVGPTVLAITPDSNAAINLNIGCYFDISAFWDGAIDAIGWWNGRILTVAEQDALLNAGAGVQYPF